MITLSLCMIVKNEEEVLGRCLDSVKDIFDEIIIVDTGSSDRTKEIAVGYTNKIYDFEWIEDFSAARNYSFEKATKDYQMWLDADDIITEIDKNKILKLKQELDSSVNMVMMKYNTSFDINGNPTFSYYRERIFQRSMNYRWSGAIHEVIPPYGNIIYSDAAVSHKKLRRNDPERNLRIFEKLIFDGKTLEPRQQFYYARELYYNKRYDEAIQIFNNFLDSGLGWVENCINACQDLSYCYYSINDNKMALSSLFRSFEFDEPRAEICCDIGKHFYDLQKYKQAIFWYEVAASRKYDEASGGFKQIDCYGYIPYIQLCMCYYRLGDTSLAEEFNFKAITIKPDDENAKRNKVFFDGLHK